MNRIRAILWAEALKARRSKTLLISLSVAVAFPLMLGFIMLIIKNPDLARGSRILVIKSTMMGKATWANFTEYLSMGITMVGLILFGFVTAWVFGREYSDRTAKDLLAMPVPRSATVFSKFAVVALWSLALSIVMYFAGLAVGFLVGLEGYDASYMLSRAATLAYCAPLTILLCTPVAFFACWGRGFLPPLGFILGSLALVQFAGFGGYSPYVPWAIPGLLAGMSGPEAARLGPVSYAILFVTVIAGYWATYAWWRFADQT